MSHSKFIRSPNEPWLCPFVTMACLLINVPRKIENKYLHSPWLKLGSKEPKPHLYTESPPCDVKERNVQGSVIKSKLEQCFLKLLQHRKPLISPISQKHDTFLKRAYSYTLMKDTELNALRCLASTNPCQWSYTVINLDNLLFPGYFALLDGTLDGTNQPWLPPFLLLWVQSNAHTALNWAERGLNAMAAHQTLSPRKAQTSQKLPRVGQTAMCWFREPSRTQSSYKFPKVFEAALFTAKANHLPKGVGLWARPSPEINQTTAWPRPPRQISLCCFCTLE